MNNSFKQLTYILGIITILYISFRYVLPFLFKAVGWILGVFLYVIIIALAITAIIYIISYITQLIKK